MGLMLSDSFVDTAIGYFDKLGITEEQIDLNETGDKSFLISIEEYNLVGQILATQVAHWCLRGTGNCCGSNVDVMRDIMREKKNLYQQTYNKEFEGFNDEAMW